MVRLLLVGLLAVTSGPLAAKLNIERPGEREFVLDLAGVLSESDEGEIRRSCDALLIAKATPIVVVVIRSMAEHGGAGMSIEAFAAALFNQWGIGHAQLADKPWNTGMLLLVSIGDRRARIELGAGWAHSRDEKCRQIMDELIVPAFKRGDYPQGIKSGVQGMAAMAQGLEIPTAPRHWSAYLFYAALALIGVLMVVSLARNGRSGWAWAFWGIAFGVLVFMMTRRGRGHSGGGFFGGSFGGSSGGGFGGFSGGGGASGSW